MPDNPLIADAEMRSQHAACIAPFGKTNGRYDVGKAVSDCSTIAALDAAMRYDTGKASGMTQKQSDLEVQGKGASLGRDRRMPDRVSMSLDWEEFDEKRRELVRVAREASEDAAKATRDLPHNPKHGLLGVVHARNAEQSDEKAGVMRYLSKASKEHQKAAEEHADARDDALSNDNKRIAKLHDVAFMKHTKAANMAGEARNKLQFIKAADPPDDSPVPDPAQHAVQLSHEACMLTDDLPIHVKSEAMSDASNEARSAADDGDFGLASEKHQKCYELHQAFAMSGVPGHADAAKMHRKAAEACKAAEGQQAISASNPEGINQYSKGYTGSAKMASKAAKKSSNKAYRTNTLEDHTKAADDNAKAYTAHNMAKYKASYKGNKDKVLYHSGASLEHFNAYHGHLSSMRSLGGQQGAYERTRAGDT